MGIKYILSGLLSLFLWCGGLYPSTAQAGPSGKERMKLLEAIEKISQEYDVYFTFDMTLVSKMEVQYERALYSSAEDAISRILKGTGLKYQFYDRRFVILYKDDASGLESLKQMSKHLNGLISEGEKKMFSTAKHDLQAVTRLPSQSILKTIPRVAFSVEGKVTNQEREPLIGVTVQVKGNGKATTTDSRGHFALNDIDANAVLVFSYVGFETQEVKVAGRSNVRVVMASASQALGEVVVVGYGKQSRKQITGAIETINPSQTRDFPQITAADRLKGQAAGLVVSQPNGKPGANPTLRIRGMGSLGAGDNPLIVIDGFPIGNQIPQSLNPDDIASISVLKDASSTAIYGARGANGVVVISTKKANLNQRQLDFSTSIGYQNIPQSRRLEMLNGKEYAQFMKEAFEERIRVEGATQNVPSIYQNPEQYGEGTDWFDELIVPNAPMANYNLSYMGGGEYINGVISAGYAAQDGVLPNTKFNRVSLRSNLIGKINNNITAGLNLMGARTMDNTPPTDGSQAHRTAGGGISQAYLMSPLQSPYLNDGSLRPFITEPENPNYISMPNPIFQLLERENDIKRMELNATGFFEAKFLNDFSYRMNFGVNHQNGTTQTFRPSTIGFWWEAPPKQAAATYETFGVMSWNLDNLLNYSKQFGDHYIAAILGYTAQKSTSESSYILVEGFPDDDVHTITRGQNVLSRTSAGSEWALAASFMRVNYNYKDKYLLEGTFRREGSSRFGENSKYGNFPSGSLGWRISEESFFPVTRWLSSLKIRTSYGITGNNNIGDYRHIAAIANANYVFNNTLSSGSMPGSFANTNLAWEKSKQFDVGIELDAFHNSIHFHADYYKKRTGDMLFSIPIPAITGYTNSWTNLGDVENEGVELTLTSNQTFRQVRWSSNFNVSFNRNKVLDLGGQPQVLHGNYNISVVGRSIGMFYGYKTLGIYNSQSDLDNYPGWANARPRLGDVIFEDVDGDRVISSLDRTVIGNPHPKMTFGFTNRIGYKNFDLSVLLTGATGYGIFNINHDADLNMFGRYNVRKLVLNRWKSPTEPGDGVTPAATAQNSRQRQSSWIYKGDHLWVKNISLSYAVPENLIARYKIKGIRVYTSVLNPFLFAYFDESNPELGDGNAGRDGVSTALGLNGGSYPVARVFSFGISATF
jgi:TonB-linked SusC/RagA family outer membrane protein